jgi:hypothetical protein
MKIQKNMGPGTVYIVARESSSRVYKKISSSPGRYWQIYLAMWDDHAKKM